MKKKYKCRLTASSLLVKVKGKVVRCEFEPAVLSAYGLRGCAYTTENKDIQYAIEHSPRFHRGDTTAIWTDDVEQKEEVVVTRESGARMARRGRTKKEE